MKVCYPVYFHRFHCIAGSCPDSCCKEWDVQVDACAAKYYRALPGPLGQRLRAVMALQEDGSAIMMNENGRCPMWRDDGLCRIQAELGEDALCQVCREFPRLTHDYGTFIEYGLELSCPEAAKYILSDLDFKLDSTTLPGDALPQYDTEAMDVLLRTREQAIAILRDPRRSIPEALALLLLYGYHAQEELDGAEASDFVPSIPAIDSAGNAEAICAFFRELEILTPAWQQLLDRPERGEWTSAHRSLAGYLVRRYWLQAVSDYDLVCRVKFIVASCLLVRNLGSDVLRTAQLFSKEIENNADNVDAILDGAYCHEALTDINLLACLAGG